MYPKRNYVYPLVFQYSLTCCNNKSVVNPQSDLLTMWIQVNRFFAKYVETPFLVFIIDNLLRRICVYQKSAESACPLVSRSPGNCSQQFSINSTCGCLIENLILPYSVQVETPTNVSEVWLTREDDEIIKESKGFLSYRFHWSNLHSFTFCHLEFLKMQWELLVQPSEIKD